MVCCQAKIHEPDGWEIDQAANAHPAVGHLDDVGLNREVRRCSKLFAISARVLLQGVEHVILFSEGISLRNRSEP